MEITGILADWCLLILFLLGWTNRGGGMLRLLGGRRSGAVVGSLPGNQGFGRGVWRRTLRRIGGWGVVLG